MKFCPQCGQSRAGNFCGKCGFAFSSQDEVNLTTSAGVWLDDPSDPNQQRFWDGSSWTQLTRPKTQGADHSALTRALLRKLVYGPDFDAEKHCSNCGKPFGRSKTCSVCDA
jgi:hypothetical protein